MKKIPFLVIFFLALQSQAQQFPETISLPVTFYDFHSDKSNPEFEQPHLGGVKLGMVGSTLDGERKPVLGPVPYRNYGIAKWFRPWQAGDFTIPSYTVLSGGELNAQIQYNGMVTVGYDTAFKNVVIPMALPFTYIPGSTGMYEYYNQNFFMLDGQGLGNEGREHNFSYTMELHTDFLYNQGLVFNFEGDDDVWVFINGRLALDIGGIHQTATGSINLDTLTGMDIGKKYNFDLFYAERHTSASDIRITTNLFTPPGYLQLFSKPDAPGPGNPRLGPLDSATAGQPFTVYAHVFDSLYNWIPENDSKVTWTMTDALGNPVLSTTTGASTSFTPTEAYGIVTITATFTDPADPSKILTAAIKVFVGPGAAHHVVIEGDSLARTTRDNRPVVSISVDRSVSKTVYAVVRDEYGNFVRFANNATWTMANTAIASATPLSGRQWAANVAEVSFGNTQLTASEGGLIPGTATVACTSPNAPVPVTATLLDVNGNGHLDRIDIVLPDSVALGATLPTVQQLITAMNIVSTDGGKAVTLTASSMTVEGTRTIHVTLTENTGSTLETGWTTATITLADISMTADGRSIYVAQIIDGAEPVIKSVCFVPMPLADTLRVTFSEPLRNATKPIDEYNILSVVHQNGSTEPMNASSVRVLKYEEKYLYVFGQNTLSGQDSVKSGSRTFGLDLCGDVSIVQGSRAVGNPFVPGVTLIPPSQRPGSNDPSSGTRIEVSFIKAVVQDIPAGKIKASVSIFDAVGNSIVDRELMNPDLNAVKLYWIWDGRTRKGSWAAPGTYLARIYVEDLVRDRKQSIRMNVGIKK